MQQTKEGGKDMEEETKKLINEKIREFLKKAIQLIKAIKNPLNCE